jgi:hypothetical protein
MMLQDHQYIKIHYKTAITSGDTRDVYNMFIRHMF